MDPIDYFGLIIGLMIIGFFFLVSLDANIRTKEIPHIRVKDKLDNVSPVIGKIGETKPILTINRGQEAYTIEFLSDNKEIQRMTYDREEWKYNSQKIVGIFVGDDGETFLKRIENGISEEDPNAFVNSDYYRYELHIDKDVYEKITNKQSEDFVISS